MQDEEFLRNLSLAGQHRTDRVERGWWCIISTTIWCPAWLACHSHIQRTFPSTRSWIVHNTKLVNDTKKVRDAKDIQGVFFNWPPLKMSLDWPPLKMPRLAPPKSCKYENHIKVLRHLDFF